ncbi:MAG: L-histidine N(alpha)-methyltransferase, partial [Longimicrobiales bacterium]
MEPDDALRFLRRLAPLAGPAGLLIVGVDCKKDRDTLELAYNDPEGVTAEFNRNILAHVNRSTGSDFDLEAFQHYAFYNETAGRIEMHLIATSEQTVHFPDPLRGELRIRLHTGEPIVTEHSYKYTIDEFQGLARAAGYTADDVLTDADENFAVHVLSGA